MSTPAPQKKRKMGVVTQSPVHETVVSVAMLGKEGGFSHTAAASFFRGSFDAVAATSVEEVCEAVASGRADRGIVPVENSYNGTFHSTYDALLQFAPRVQIVNEVVCDEQHSLCARADTSLESVRRVFAHPAAFDQCAVFVGELDKKTSGQLHRELAKSTSAAVAAVAAGSEPSAAIATPAAAAAHGLVVIRDGISSDAHNQTRFVVIAAKAKASEPPHGVLAKTSVAIAVRNEPAAIFKCLSCFALRGINVAKVCFYLPLHFK